jgi:hypothetical protein
MHKSDVYAMFALVYNTYIEYIIHGSGGVTMFGMPFFHVPGQGIRAFDVYRPEMNATERGRVIINKREKIGTVKAILAQTKPDSWPSHWGMDSSPVSHEITIQGRNKLGIKAGDLLECECRSFYVQRGVNDPGELGMWTILYCLERFDV